MRCNAPLERHGITGVHGVDLGTSTLARQTAAGSSSSRPGRGQRTSRQSDVAVAIGEGVTRQIGGGVSRQGRAPEVDRVF